MPLTDQNVAYYKMEESTGSLRADAINNLNLTNHGSVTQETGEVGFGAGFHPTSIFVGTDWLSHAHDARFSIDKAGADGFSVTLWVYPTVASQGGGIFAKGFNNGGHQLEYQLLQNSIDNGVQWSVYNPFGSGSATAISSGAMTLNDWNFVYCWYRSSDGQIGVQIGCSSPATATLTPNTPFNGTGDFLVGSYFNNVRGYWAGRIDELSIWQRMLTSDEVDFLCPGGKQYPYPTTSCALWKAYFKGFVDGEDMSTGAFGVANEFFICGPLTANEISIAQQDAVDINGWAAGVPGIFKIERDGTDARNTDSNRQSLIGIEILYDKA